MKKILLPICIYITVLISCGPTQKVLDAKEDAIFNKWLNYPKEDLIKAWGEPDSAVSDGKSGQILIYKEAVDYKSVMNERYTGIQYSFRKEMYINKDSRIYYWKAWRRK